MEFGDRLHSLDLYGSVPRGTAIEGRSDLDVSAVLRDQVRPEDSSRVASLASELDRGTTAVDGVDGVGILIDPRELFLAASERYDGAFHISCLCTPLWGPDLARELPEQRPTRELAYGIGRGASGWVGRPATNDRPTQTRSILFGLLVAGGSPNGTGCSAASRDASARGDR